MIELIKSFWEWLKDQGPALAILIYDFEDAKAKKALQDKAQAELELKLKENHEKVSSDNRAVSDVDGVGKIAGPRD